VYQKLLKLLHFSVVMVASLAFVVGFREFLLHDAMHSADYSAARNLSVTCRINYCFLHLLVHISKLSVVSGSAVRMICCT